MTNFLYDIWQTYVDRWIDGYNLLENYIAAKKLNCVIYNRKKITAKNLKY